MRSALGAAVALYHPWLDLVCGSRPVHCGMDRRDPSNGRLIRHGPFPSLGRSPVSPDFRKLSGPGQSAPSHGSPAPAARRPVKPTKQFAATTKPFSWVDEDVLKPRSASMTFDQTMGCDHVCVHHQLNLPRNSQDLSVRNAQARNQLMGLWARDRNLRRTANEPDCESMTTVIFACPKCGLVHEVTQVHVPTKKSGGSIASTAEPQSTLGMVCLNILAARPSVWTAAVVTQH